MEQMGQMAPLGAAVYGSLILMIEGVVRMFWALSRIFKDIEKWRQEGRDEVIRKLLENKVDIPPDILKELEDLDHDTSKR